MRFIIMHKTNAHWEAGAVATPELIERVGGLIGDLAAAGVLLAGEGLRPSSEGVRLSFSTGTRTLVKGPFTGVNELPAAFDIVRAQSLDEVIEWASRQADVLGDIEIDIRPVTEEWDLGLEPKPETPVRRYMVLRKATGTSEAGAAPSPAQRAELSRLIATTKSAVEHLVTETLAPSRRGRRYKHSQSGIVSFDGPFIESKELLGGYVIISGASLDQVDQWARRYIVTVGAQEVDVREVENAT